MHVDILYVGPALQLDNFNLCIWVLTFDMVLVTSQSACRIEDKL